jgi:hypothetical protein
MKKTIAVLVVLFSFLVLFGCATTYDTIPPGKTESDWAKDEQFCLYNSNRVTGFWAANPVGLAWNLGYAEQKNKDCLRERGWIKNPDNIPLDK